LVFFFLIYYSLLAWILVGIRLIEVIPLVLHN